MLRKFQLPSLINYNLLKIYYVVKTIVSFKINISVLIEVRILIKISSYI